MSGSLTVLVVVAVVWLLISLIPMRSIPAGRAWGVIILGVSALFVLVAGLFASQVEVSDSYQGESPTLLVMLVVAIALAPGAIVALVRRGKSG
ncbi:hypothetical protein [Streptomyces sp. NBC_00572]|uniref:hypothetical protein n=1 Tax=Streptomyces sp. NBC_00572 TaxID=2903664 RepID=UPI00224D0F6D|nr:hypothetical protein [Streptomyces sp. NBC_00572]MCX4985828.1 hypothetical protein [Streptomyces sp. NBC_00572]